MSARNENARRQLVEAQVNLSRVRFTADTAGCHFDLILTTITKKENYVIALKADRSQVWGIYLRSDKA